MLAFQTHRYLSALPVALAHFQLMPSPHARPLIRCLPARFLKQASSSLPIGLCWQLWKGDKPAVFDGFCFSGVQIAYLGRLGYVNRRLVGNVY